MPETRRPLIAGNWKMNGLADESLLQIKDLAARASKITAPACDVLICPPATLLRDLAKAVVDSPVSIGGQDCHANEKGAHTGDISAAMLKDSGAHYCVVGHSERRTDHGETNGDVKSKAEAVLREGLIAIVCVGETLAERETGITLAVISDQVKILCPAVRLQPIR